MKKIFKILLVLLIFIFSFSLLNNKTYAKGDLDRIDEYVVTVDPDFKDGSLNIKIDIKWTVLDDFSEGPLEWVKIGIPNYHAENIEALSSNIKKIKYYSDDGSFIRIDFNEKYYENEQAIFSFKYNQSYMYHIYDDYIIYDYNPGYFNDIKVSNMILKWNKNNVIDITKTTLDYEEIDGYYVYKSPLNYGEYIKINLKYENNSFEYIDPEKTYTNDYEKYPWLMPTIIISFFVLFFVLLFLIKKFTYNPYNRERGFFAPTNWIYYWRRPHYYRTYHNGGVTREGKPINPPVSSVGGGRSSGGGCACACACACAGGGRAGCSIKDFYHTNIRSEKLKKVLLKEHKSC